MFIIFKINILRFLNKSDLRISTTGKPIGFIMNEHFKARKTPITILFRKRFQMYRCESGIAV